MKMNASRISVVTCFTFAGAGLLGCDHNGHAKSADPVPSGPESHLKAATNDIVSARCNREERCNNIGADKTYESREACTTKLHGSTESDLNLKDCSRGVDHVKLDECLAKIKGEDCGNPIDTLGRVAACRTGALCIDS
jgi:Family of unknown function (DUF6184)